MVKAGDLYMELVAKVREALDPGASVKTGQWIEGPDGEREVDVEVRGTVDGNLHFVLVEAKDWKKRVDVQTVDALDSKRKDLKADAAFIYSNSGFTTTAIRKAGRVGISLASALAAGDERVHLFAEGELFRKHLSVDFCRTMLYLSECAAPEGWNFQSLYFHGLPVMNWLHTLSLGILREHEGKRRVTTCFVFKEPTAFHLGEHPIMLRGFQFIFECSRKWLSQPVRVDLSLGHYDYTQKTIIIPDQQWLRVGVVDPEKWIALEGPPPWEGEDSKSRPLLTLLTFNPLRAMRGQGIPPLDDLIQEREVKAE
jgi:Restriction endonuclease